MGQQIIPSLHISQPTTTIYIPYQITWERREQSSTSMEGLCIFLFQFCVLFSILTTCTAVDTIAANQTIRYGETIVSAGEYFELGFFKPSDSSENLYLGIWYKRLANGTVAWVANRNTPLANTSGVLTLGGDGILALQNSTSGIIWSSNSSGTVRNPVAQLLDSGNLVIRDESDTNPENFIWQSFDYPTDTFLPGMKLGKNLVTGMVTNFTSWNSTNDPSEGEYMIYMDFNGYPQVYQSRNSVIQYRLGSWNGIGFTGMPSLKPNPIFTYDFVFSQEEIYYKFELISPSVLTKMRLDSQGNMQRLNWNDRIQGWFLFSTPTTDSCVRYALCGVYGSCNINNSPACGCLTGFQPRRPEEWNVSDWSSGCQRKVSLDCGAGEGFQKYSGVKLPDTRKSWFNRSMTLAECEMMCKNNCTCTAYSNLNISGDGSGCLLWFGDLVDIREFPESKQDIYIRLAASELEKDRSSGQKRRVRIIVIPVMIAIAIALGLCLFYVFKQRKLKRRVLTSRDSLGRDSREDYTNESQKNDLDLPLFSFSTLLLATNHFSVHNKLGEGGFGPVYKGLLEEGREIAVKRLSATSTQGIEEFKNEVSSISKLQHRNLVKLLGYCIQGDEKMLVYEYMANKALDSIIFDETEKKLLDWPKRFNIINGVARGLLYLHQDSRLRIIHRDLKAGNILLDYDMTPKISDFGMARSFGGNESETNTRRVVGTYGYMSPEYAGDGIFSIKSDVFSFGVLVLEIVSGKKNRGFVHEDHHHNLLGHAWRLHQEGKSLELIDASVSHSCNVSQVLRSIHIGLLCVQQSPEDRPNMSSVVLMLSSEGGLPQPKQPGFYTESGKFGPETSSSMQAHSSTNDVTITLLYGR